MFYLLLDIITDTIGDGNIMAYIMGKAEGKGTNWHGHVTAVTVINEYL